MDRISKLPLGIIETILCLLPIQEAARTSILSREWRYHWTKIPKLEFIEDTFEVANNADDLSVLEQTSNRPSKKEKMVKRSKFINAVYHVLLIHQGPIHEFTLSMVADALRVETDHIILHLLKNKTLKMLKLDFSGPDRLPISLFSLHQLASMYLHGCALYQERSFDEFGCLTTLHLGTVWADTETLLRLLSSCPVLKRLTLDCECSVIFSSRETTIVDLFNCLPVIEYLHVVLFIVECFVPKRHLKELPIALVHLKYLCMDCFCFNHIEGLPFLALLIRSSPNLEKLKLVMYNENWIEEEDIGSFTLDDYSDIMLEHLKELVIQDFGSQEHELDFVRLILAKSPVLKKVRVSPYYHFNKDEEPQVLKILSCSPCASPLVEIIVGRLKSN